MSIFGNKNTASVTAEDIRNSQEETKKDISLESNKQTDRTNEKYSAMKDKIEKLKDEVKDSAKETHTISTLSSDIRSKLSTTSKYIKKQYELLKEEAYNRAHQYGPSLSDVMNKMKEISEKVKGLAEKGMEKLAVVKDKVKEKGLGGILGLLAKLAGAAFFIKQVWPLIKDKIKPFFNEIIKPFFNDVIKPFFTDTVIPFLTDTVVPYMTDTVLPFMKDMLINKGWPLIRDNLKEVLLGGALLAVLTKPSMILRLFGSMLGSLIGGVAKLTYFLASGLVSKAFKLGLGTLKLSLKVLSKSAGFVLGQMKKVGVSALNLGTKLAGTLVQVGTKAKSVMLELGTKIKDTVVNKAKKGLTNLSDKMGLTKLVRDAKAKVLIVKRKMTELKKNAGNTKMGKAAKKVGAIVKIAKGGFSKVFKVLKVVARGIPFLGTIIMAWDLFQTFFPGLADKLLSFMTLDNLKKIGSSIIGGITSVFDGSLFGWISEKIGEFTKDFSISAIFDKVTNSITGLLGEDSMGAKIWETVSDAIVGMSSWFGSKITSLINGVSAGLEKYLRGSSLPFMADLADVIFGEKKIDTSVSKDTKTLSIDKSSAKVNELKKSGDINEVVGWGNDRINNWEVIKTLDPQVIRQMAKSGAYDDDTSKALEQIATNKFRNQNFVDKAAAKEKKKVDGAKLGVKAFEANTKTREKAIEALKNDNTNEKKIEALKIRIEETKKVKGSEEAVKAYENAIKKLKGEKARIISIHKREIKANIGRIAKIKANEKARLEEKNKKKDPGGVKVTIKSFGSLAPKADEAESTKPKPKPSSGTKSPAASAKTGTTGTTGTKKNVTSKTTTKKKANNNIKDIFKIYGTVNTKDLNPNLLKNLKAMGNEYKDKFGTKMQINSGYRSFSHQARLRKKLGKKAALPGKSMHNYGMAVDMNSTDNKKAIDAGLFDKYGFWRPIKKANETQHVEPIGIDRKGIRDSGMAEYAKTGKQPVAAMIGEDKGEAEGTNVDADIVEIIGDSAGSSNPAPAEKVSAPAPAETKTLKVSSKTKEEGITNVIDKQPAKESMQEKMTKKLGPKMANFISSMGDFGKSFVAGPESKELKDGSTLSKAKAGTAGSINSMLDSVGLYATDSEAERYREDTGTQNGLTGSLWGLATNPIVDGYDTVTSWFGDGEDDKKTKVEKDIEAAKKVEAAKGKTLAKVDKKPTDFMSSFGDIGKAFSGEDTKGKDGLTLKKSKAATAKAGNSALNMVGVGATDSEGEKYREDTGTQNGLAGSLWGLATKPIVDGYDKVTSWFGDDKEKPKLNTKPESAKGLNETRPEVAPKRDKNIPINNDTRALAKSTALPKYAPPPKAEKPAPATIISSGSGQQSMAGDISLSSTKKNQELLPLLGDWI